MLKNNLSKKMVMLFSLLFFVSLKPVLASERMVSFPYAALNPKVNQQISHVFPGFRGENQLVIYDRNSGHSMTGTNGYGFEIIVKGSFAWGEVVSIGGNNNEIPVDGYVLSGHGAAEKYLKANALIGSLVVVDLNKGLVNIKTSSETMLNGLHKAVLNAEETYEKAKEKLYDVDYEAIQKTLQDTKNTLMIAEKNANANNLQDIIQVADEKCQEVLWRSLESKRIEGRGLWHRPVEKNIEEVRATLDAMVKDNFNMLYLETFFDGYTIFPSKTPLVKQTPKFVGITYGEKKLDLLEAFIEEAKKRNIEVHAWVENFFVGYHQGNEKISPILMEKPEWACINYDGTTIAKNEGENADFYFMDPANQEVHKFLISLYVEMISKYDLAGINLDYIRYPVIEYAQDGGYTNYAMNAYKKKFNLPQSTNLKALISYQTNPGGWQKEWQRWNKWRQDNISEFVKNVSQKLRVLKPTILISAANFADIEDAKEKKMQDWLTWNNKGYIDFFTPMIYLSDVNSIRQKASKKLFEVNEKAFTYVGIAPSYMKLPPEENAWQIKVIRDIDAQGVAIFAAHNIFGKNFVEDILRGGVYRQKALIPHADIKILAKAFKEDLLDKAKRLYIPAGKMTSSQLESLKLNLQKICDYAEKERLEMALSSIESLALKANDYALGEAGERIEDYATNFANIVRIKVNQQKLRNVK